MNTRQKTLGLTLIASIAALVACGGGGGGAVNRMMEALGLASKPALSPLNFPGDPAVAGDVAVARAYPNLSFSAPLVFAQAPGDSSKAYVATQGGQIFVFDNRADVASSRVFLDLTDRTRNQGEQGLLGMAFDPNFASNRFVYAYYSKNANPNVDAGNAVVTRFRVAADGLSADRASGQQLLSEPDRFNNHNGGSLAFGPDGMLYLALGDGGSGGDPDNNAQNLGNVLGKIIRIRPDGSIPSDNPFVGTSGARGEIWAYGLRNPFRMSFDAATGALWTGDVGQNQFEEIDVISKGGNYGWRLREGMHDFNTSDPRPSVPLIEPIFEYDHSKGCSITGGVVYRGAAIPSLVGQYLYSDFCSGTLWSLQHENGQRAIANTVLGSVPNPSGFWEDSNREVVVTSLDGNLYRIQPNPGTGAQIPKKLSETGLFTDTTRLNPQVGLIEYRVNSVFYSDGTEKRRWFGLPSGARIPFNDGNSLQLPRGAVTVKHFEITLADGSTRRLETRVFFHGSNGWNGYTYKWNAAGTDADLLEASEQEVIATRGPDGSPRSQTYEYPSRSDCLNCHNPAAGIPLGLTSAQLNRSQTFASTGVTDNQLRAYNHVSIFDRDIGAPEQYLALPDPFGSAPLNARARSYLDVNCGNCHRPGGPTGVDMDLRFSTAIADSRSRNVPPTGGDLGIAGAQRIVAGRKEQSLVWERMRRTDSNRMPPIASHVVDDAGLALIGQWIDAGAND